MKGISEKIKDGKKYIYIGHANKKMSRVFYFLAVPILIALAVWIFFSLSQSNWRVLQILLIYAGAFLIYGTLGVWLHEQLHCLGFRGTANEANTSITYERKFGVLLTGYYSVEGEIEYPILRRALLMPLCLAAGFILIGCIGALFLPGWWLPILLTLAVVSIFDMIHDIYMVSEMRKIGTKGIYKDCGHYLEVILRE